MFPVRSNSAGACGPRNHSRACHPIGVGSSPGSRAAGAAARHGTRCRWPAPRQGARPGPPRSTDSAFEGGLDLLAVHPAHHCKSDAGAGPNTRSHRLAAGCARPPRPARAGPAPPSPGGAASRRSHASGRNHSNCPDVQPPLRCPRMISPSAAISTSTRRVTFDDPAVGLVRRVCELRSQPRLVRGQFGAAHAPPRAASARSAPSSTARSHPSGSPSPTPPLSRSFTSPGRSASRRHRCTPPAPRRRARRAPRTPCGASRASGRPRDRRKSPRHILRRAPGRARADRYTVTGSVACNATSADQRGNRGRGGDRGKAGPSRCRSASRPCRCATLTFAAMTRQLRGAGDDGGSVSSSSWIRAASRAVHLRGVTGGLPLAGLHEQHPARCEPVRAPLPRPSAGCPGRQRRRQGRPRLMLAGLRRHEGICVSARKAHCRSASPLRPRSGRQRANRSP